ncbi:MAG TPA: hypothetical protein PKB03_06350, partial [Baekduia sp.]|nr:hypothetical protein [Baekduia sp.]
MRARAAAVSVLAAVALMAAGCGSDDSATDVVPKKTPDLLAPEQSGIPEQTNSTSTTSTTTSTTDTTDTTDTGSTSGGTGGTDTTG